MDKDLRDELIEFVAETMYRSLYEVNPRTGSFSLLGEFVWAVRGDHRGIVVARRFMKGVRA